MSGPVYAIDYITDEDRRALLLAGWTNQMIEAALLLRQLTRVAQDIKVIQKVGE